MQATALPALLGLCFLSPVALGQVVPIETRPIANGVNDVLSFASADLDGDGDLDCIAGKFTTGEVLWFENVAGDGSQWTENLISSGEFNLLPLAIGDVDGDGNPDVVSGSGASDEVALHRNVMGDGSSWMREVITSSITDPAGLDLGDVNGDGAVDVIVSGRFPATVAWFDNASGWAEVTVYVGGGYPRWVDVVDIDGDGDRDVLSTDRAQGELRIHRNQDGVGSSWGLEILDGGIEPSYVEGVDVDGDGDRDILLAARGDQLAGGAGDEIFWLANDGESPTWSSTTIAAGGGGYRNLATGDVDGDGDLDVASVSNFTGRVGWHLNETGNGANWRAGFPWTSSGEAWTVDLADFDGDGDLDLASTGIPIGAVLLHEQVGVPGQCRPFPNLLQNGGFEIGELGGSPAGWAPQLGLWETTDLGFESGSRALLLTSNTSSSISTGLINQDLSLPVYGFTEDELGNATGARLESSVQEATSNSPSLHAPRIFAELLDSDGFTVSVSSAGFSTVGPDEWGVALVDIGAPVSPATLLTQIFSESFGASPDELLLLFDSQAAYVLVGGDCDQDGISDACRIAEDPTLDLDSNGVLDACEGFSGSLGELSAQDGGVVSFQLDGGAEVANDLYVLLGSASGTIPGIAFGGLVLPLNPFDPYFNFILGSGNSGPFQGTFGFLSPEGTGQAAIAFPPLDPSTAGLVLHHAWIGIEVGQVFTAQFVSNALPLAIVP